MLATPAMARVIWIRKLVSPTASPMAPAAIIGMVTLLSNIAATCWMPRGINSLSGGWSSMP